MENTRLKMEGYQKLLYTLGWIVLAIGCVLLVLRMTDVFDFGICLIIACCSVSGILQSICLWNSNPKTYTWVIALDAFLFGLSLADVIDRLLA